MSICNLITPLARKLAKNKFGMFFANLRANGVIMLHILNYSLRIIDCGLTIIARAINNICRCFVGQGTTSFHSGHQYSFFTYVCKFFFADSAIFDSVQPAHCHSYTAVKNNFKCIRVRPGIIFAVRQNIACIKFPSNTCVIPINVEIRPIYVRITV